MSIIIILYNKNKYLSIGNYLLNFNKYLNRHELENKTKAKNWWVKAVCQGIENSTDKIPKNIWIRTKINMIIDNLKREGLFLKIIKLIEDIIKIK